jgi:UDP-N-acetylglucosamine 2-epimerase (non-hydrolysing)
MKLLHIVGARPNFPKLAPVYRAARARGLNQVIVHTGQHYDEAMSDSFFESLDIAAPGHNLAVGSASHAVQTARIMERLEPVLQAESPDWLVVYGDVNSTVAASLVAAKLLVRTAHVEAGLRSDDRTMPEEINRLVTDRLADLLLTPSRDADARLRAEGEPASKIVFVGNVMIDSLHFAARRLGVLGADGRLPPSDGSVLVTLHRPSNVDEPARLECIMAVLRTLAEQRRVRFPAHPRTEARLRAFGIGTGAVELMPPVVYDDMLRLMTAADAVVTDSGGVQEETTALGIPCFTLRENTERPVTVTEGTNRLVPDPAALPGLLAGAQRLPIPRPPEGWDGRAGDRVVDALLARASSRAAATAAVSVG